MAEAKAIAMASIGLGIAICLLIIGCALENWWPMLNLVTYMFLPLPFLFCGRAPDFGEISGMQLFGNFVTGALFISSFAVCIVLHHINQISVQTLLLCEASNITVFLSAAGYVWYVSRQQGGSMYSSM